MTIRFLCTKSSRLFTHLLSASAMLSCGSSSTPLAAFDAGSGVHRPAESRRLGMNDVSMLLPLPATVATPTLAAMAGIHPGAELVPRALFERLVVEPNDAQGTYEAFQLVAVRFDLCDRREPGACPAGTDGRLRLVLQPLQDTTDGTIVDDAALHAFYPIPADELGTVVDELRALAAIQNAPLTEPLWVSPALSSRAPDARYVERLSALVGRYALGSKLTRLTLFSLHPLSAGLIWTFRGVEGQDGAFSDMTIPGIEMTKQKILLDRDTTDTTYQATPVADIPSGFATAIDARAFGAATGLTRTQSLTALTAAQNPLQHGPGTVQCVACHVSTFLTERRSATAGIDPVTIEGRYVSTYNVSNPVGISQKSAQSLRAFGWLYDKPAISQRVVNDSAQVLTEIENRFPPAAP